MTADPDFSREFLSVEKGADPHWRRLRTRPTQRYLLYVPKDLSPDARVLVTIHGISRNAAEMIRAFRPEAERRGIVLVAPYFGRRRFGDYQRLNRKGRGRRADRVLLEILDEVSTLTGCSTRRVSLFGYSGGGQFAHRFAFLRPNRVDAMVIGAAGWYTLPNPAFAYPLGIGACASLKSSRFSLPELLTVPALVMVGENDVDCGPELRQRPEVNLHQGLDRVERARTWVVEMRHAAQIWGLEPRHELMLLPGAGHDFAACAAVPQMTETVFDFYERAAHKDVVCKPQEEEA